jgi:hypothetical protein
MAQRRGGRKVESAGREREREREREEEEKKRACAAHLDFYLMQPFDQDGCSEKTNRG